MTTPRGQHPKDASSGPKLPANPGGGGGADLLLDRVEELEAELDRARELLAAEAADLQAEVMDLREELARARERTAYLEAELEGKEKAAGLDVLFADEVVPVITDTTDPLSTAGLEGLLLEGFTERRHADSDSELVAV